MSEAYFNLKQRTTPVIIAGLAIAAILSFAAAAVTILEHGTAMALSPHVISAALG